MEVRVDALPHQLQQPLGVPGHDAAHQLTLPALTLHLHELPRVLAAADVHVEDATFVAELREREEEEGVLDGRTSESYV